MLDPVQPLEYETGLLSCWLDSHLSRNETHATLSLIGQICHNWTGITSTMQEELRHHCIASGLHIKGILTSIPVTGFFVCWRKKKRTEKSNKVVIELQRRTRKVTPPISCPVLEHFLFETITLRVKPVYATVKFGTEPPRKECGPHNFALLDHAIHGFLWGSTRGL